jgi:hypothetical protein
MITLEDLKQKDACYWDGKKHELADRVEANLPATLHEIMQWDWVPVNDREWVFLEFAEDSLYQTYRDAKAPPYQTYLDAEAPLWQTYLDANHGPSVPNLDAKAPLYQTYLDAEAPLRQTYEDAKAELLKDLTCSK